MIYDEKYMICNILLIVMFKYSLFLLNAEVKLMEQTKLFKPKIVSDNSFSLGQKIREYVDLAKVEIPNAVERLRKSIK